jgi:hypothetical protein
MRAYEAKAALDAAGVRERAYAIRGIPHAEMIEEGSVVIGPDSGGWTAWASERGRTTVIEEFPDEDQACRWLVSILIEEKKRLDRLTGNEN